MKSKKMIVNTLVLKSWTDTPSYYIKGHKLDKMSGEPVNYFQGATRVLLFRILLKIIYLRCSAFYYSAFHISSMAMVFEIWIAEIVLV